MNKLKLLLIYMSVKKFAQIRLFLWHLNGVKISSCPSGHVPVSDVMAVFSFFKQLMENIVISIIDSGQTFYWFLSFTHTIRC